MPRAQLQVVRTPRLRYELDEVDCSETFIDSLIRIFELSCLCNTYLSNGLCAKSLWRDISSDSFVTFSLYLILDKRSNN